MINFFKKFFKKKTKSFSHTCSGNNIIEKASYPPDLIALSPDALIVPDSLLGVTAEILNSGSTYFIARDNITLSMPTTTRDIKYRILENLNFVEEPLSRRYILKIKCNLPVTHEDVIHQNEEEFKRMIEIRLNDAETQLHSFINNLKAKLND